VKISWPHTPIASKDYLKRGKFSTTVASVGAWTPATVSRRPVSLKFRVFQHGYLSSGCQTIAAVETMVMGKSSVNCQVLTYGLTFMQNVKNNEFIVK